METYRTKDINIASYLVVAGYRMVGTEWEGHKLYFIFEASVAQQVALYRINSDGEYARKLLQAYRTLHGMILDERDRQATA